MSIGWPVRLWKWYLKGPCKTIKTIGQFINVNYTLSLLNYSVLGFKSHPVRPIALETLMLLSNFSTLSILIIIQSYVGTDFGGRDDIVVCCSFPCEHTLESVRASFCFTKVICNQLFADPQWLHAIIVLKERETLIFCVIVLIKNKTTITLIYKSCLYNNCKQN